jgi:hypothetical protein
MLTAIMIMNRWRLAMLTRSFTTTRATTTVRRRGDMP